MGLKGRDLTTNREIAEAFFVKPELTNIFQNTNTFKIQVLTPSKPFAGPTSASDDQNTTAAEGKPTKKWFYGRIIDSRMAHNNFLKHPCDSSTTTDLEAQSHLYSLHTKIILTGNDIDWYEFSVGDIIEARCEAGDNDMIYDLQFMSFVKIIDKYDKDSEKDKDCAALRELMEAWEGSSLGTTSDPSYTPCDELEPEVPVTWTVTPLTELASIIKNVVGDDRNLGISILTIAKGEQPEGDGVGGANYNHYGIMADLGEGSWGSAGEEYIQCSWKSAEGAAGTGTRLQKYRYFAGFRSDEEAAQWMASIQGQKGFGGASTGQEWVEIYWHQWAGMSKDSDVYKERVRIDGPGQISNWESAATLFDSVGGSA